MERSNIINSGEKVYNVTNHVRKPRKFVNPGKKYGEMK
jgi:hypothetical protein